MSYEIVVGIDLGPVYSGLSWATNRDETKVNVVYDWSGSSGVGVDAERVPSRISYKDGRPLNFGHRIGPNEDSLSVNTLLLGSPSRSISSRRGGLIKPAEEVVADYLRLMWEHCQGRIQNRFGPRWATLFSLRVVLTIPAIWSNIAKQGMRNAARLANFSKTIHLVAEPEVSALAILRERKNKDLLKLGHCFVVCNLNDSNVDVISYRVRSLSPLRFEECAPGNGAFCGSGLIDQAFVKYISTIVGRDRYDRIEEKHKMRMLADFKISVKENYSGGSREYRIELPEIKSDHANGNNHETIVLKPVVVQMFFDDAIKQILQLIRGQTKQIEERGMATKAILLFGSFSTNNYLHRVIKQSIPEIHVVRATSEWSTLSSSATMWGLEHSLNNFDIGKSDAGRISRYNYGFRCAVPFNASRHVEQDRSLSEDGVKIARNQMHWVIRKGDRLEENQPITQRIIFNTPIDLLSSGVVSFSQELYFCADDKSPIRTEPSFQLLCIVQYGIEHHKLTQGMVFRSPDLSREWRENVFDFSVVHIDPIQFNVSCNNEPVAYIKAGFDNQLTSFQDSKPVYEGILESLEGNVSVEIWSDIHDNHNLGQDVGQRADIQPMLRSNNEMLFPDASGRLIESMKLPDDSGYASQSRQGVSSIASERGMSHLLSGTNGLEIGSISSPDDFENASRRQKEGLDLASEPPQAQSSTKGTDEQAADDDIESVVSDTADIQSINSVETNLLEQEGKLHLAQILASDGDLAPLCRTAMKRMDRGRFINTTRKFLKPFYRNLLQEAKTERERKSVQQLLRSRHGRYRIGTAMARFLDVDPGEEEDEEERNEAFLEQVQRRAEYLNTWITQVPHFPLQELRATEEEIVDVHDRLYNENEDSSSVDSYAPALPQLVEIENFFRTSKAFQLLTNEFRKLLLPQHLRDILSTISKSQVRLSWQQNYSFVNRGKALIEDYTQLEWDWWPLEPRMRKLKDKEARLTWECVCGKRLWLDISDQDAEVIRDVLSSMDETPPWAHRCRPRGDWQVWRSRVMRLIQQATPTSSASQRYTPSNNAASSSTSTHASIDGSSTGNATPSSTTNQNAPQLPGGPASTQQNTNSSTTTNISTQLWVLFGVKGSRRPLEMEHILIDSATNDDTFYRSLRKQYRVHRGKLRLWFSFWRFQYCEVVKFKRLAPRWVIRDCKDLPSSAEYEYHPRPPKANNPPISKHEFEMHLNACDQPCRWSWFFLHECMPPLNTSSSITLIPKKRKPFNITAASLPSQPTDAFAWGLEAKHTISALYVTIYHVLIFAGPFGFWAWWMTGHLGDVQNASVPITVVLGMLSLFWSTNGILTQGREAKGL